MVLTEYRINCRYTIALVTDLHEYDPSEVLVLLKQAKPDLICAAGDMLEHHDKGTDPRGERDFSTASRAATAVRHTLQNGFYAVKNRIMPEKRVVTAIHTYRFFREAAKIAPVFYSLGNHEWYLTEQDYAVLRESGITLLDNSDVVWNGLHIGGFSPKTDLEWFRRFCQTEGYKILLCHHPDYYERYTGESTVDLILSGHAHGGQIHLGRWGIYAPGQGFFSKYTKGMYDGRLVVSAGCANTSLIPRWGNPCEVVLLRGTQSGTALRT